MSGIIYHIFNTVNGKAYVGQTWKTLGQRWSEHCIEHSHCLHLKNAIKKS